ncbi:hypothetical protein CHU00_16070 [Sphingobacterium cellulitidis]|nr:hypothetical protein CHU00_16070 [Sphingobacterium cellulitidis]
MGGKDFETVEMRVLFSNAIKTIASKIILSNNHPSEKLKAISQD